jgi:hypothetical protein
MKRHKSAVAFAQKNRDSPSQTKRFDERTEEHGQQKPLREDKNKVDSIMGHDLFLKPKTHESESIADTLYKLHHSGLLRTLLGVFAYFCCLVGISTRRRGFRS